MRIYWIGAGKAPSLPSGLRHIGGNVYETHDAHAARELGGTDARWSLSQPVKQELPPANDPNRVLRAERAKTAAAAARARGEAAAVAEEAEVDEPTGRPHDPGTGRFTKQDPPAPDKG